MLQPLSKAEVRASPIPAYLEPLQMLLPAEPPKPSSAEPHPRTAWTEERLPGSIPLKVTQHKTVSHSYHAYMKHPNWKHLFG